MSTVNESDLHDYFALYRQYELTGDSALSGELDNRLSQYKDLFHKHVEGVLELLSEKQDDFTDEHEDAYNDLIFDLKMHAKSMEDIKRTHRYDDEQEMWVPK
jgi:hypothetical protein